MYGKVVVTARGEPVYPTEAKRVYRLRKATVSGSEVIAGAGTISVTNAYVYAYNMGDSIPPVDTALRCVRVKNFWVFAYSVCEAVGDDDSMILG